MDFKNKLVIGLIIFIVVIIIAITLISIFMDKNNDDSHSNPGTETSGILYSENPSNETLDESEYHETSSENVSIEEIENYNDAIYHGWVINNLGYTYFYKDSAYQQFNYKNSALQRYVNAINSLSKKLPNITLYNIAVPVSSSFANIPRDIYIEDNFYNASQSAFVSTVASKLPENISTVPVVSVIEQQYDLGSNVFFRSDKNWTSLGAYYAYREFCTNAGINPYELTHFREIELGEFLGSFHSAISYNATSDTNSKFFATILEKNPDNFIAYAPNGNITTNLTIYDNDIVYDNFGLCSNSVSSGNAYDFYLGTTAEYYKITSSVNGGSILIIGDSSAYPIIPFLTSHYSTIDLVNPERIKTSLSEFLQNTNYDSCLIMCYTANAVTGDFIPKLNIFTGANENE